MERKHAVGLAGFLAVLFFTFLLPGLGLRVLRSYWVFQFTIPIVITLILYRVCFPVFVPALFFTLISVLRPLLFVLSRAIQLDFPGVYYLIPILVYMGCVLSFPSLRKQVTWLQRGRLNRKTWMLIAFTVTVSAAVLVVWALVIRKDLSEFMSGIPEWAPGVLVFGGLGFAVSNAFVEEFLARAVLWDGFRASAFRPAFVILFQALLFSIWHFHGFPGGFVGAGCVFVWSIMLGVLRHRSGGLLAPMLAHFFADFTIFLILLFVIGRG